MLTHVVLFRFPDLGVAAECRDRMLAMKGRIPALLDIEVGVDIVRSDRSFDLALITRHEDLDGMQAYQVHPVHQVQNLQDRQVHRVQSLQEVQVNQQLLLLLP